MSDVRNIDRAVVAYNNTLHSAFDHQFTPLQAQTNPDIEEYYIRENMSRLNEVKELHRDAGFFNYKPGNVLLVHIDKSKTDSKFDKKRRAFNEVAIFTQYVNGNVMCDRLTRDEARKIVKLPQDGRSKGRVVIPIYYTKYVAPSLAELDKRFYALIF
jgi:hypothetical protein